MKSLPSLKSKKRYIVFEIISQNKLDYFNVKDAVWNSLSNWMGEKNLAAANVRIIKNLFSPEKGKGFIQCNHKAVDAVKTALSLIHQIGDERVVFQTLKVTGTIKSGKNKLKEG